MRFRTLRSLRIDSDISALLESFYRKEYQLLCQSSDTNSISGQTLHRALERGVPKKHYGSVLEVGGNKGEHIPFVKHTYNTYICSDLNIPSSESFNKPHDNVLFQHADVESLPFDDCSFDRVLATCLIHHLAEPYQALQEIRRCAKGESLISLFVPHDPGITYRFLRRITTLRKAIKLNAFELVQRVHAHEHRNHYLSLDMMIQEVFRRDTIRKASFPFLISGFHINAFSIYQIDIKK